MLGDSTPEQINFYLIKTEIVYLKNSISFTGTDFLNIQWLVIGQLSYITHQSCTFMQIESLSWNNQASTKLHLEVNYYRKTSPTILNT